MKRGLEILRRILLFANYLFCGVFGYVCIKDGVRGILGTSEDVVYPGARVLWVCAGLVFFGVAYGLQKFINWILQPPEARTTKDTVTTRPPPPPTVFETEEPDLPEEEEVPTPRATRFPKWVVPAAGVISGVISVVIAMVNGALAFGLLLLWAYGGITVTGGTGHTPVRELDFICAVALVGVIFGLIDICSRDGTRSWIWFAVVTVLGCLPNGFVFLVIVAIRSGPAAG